jgi:scyllo-inositol 2-dehydrogenase (NADP+)
MREPHPIRVGLIGHGLAGGIIHAPLIEAAGGYRITAVASSRDLARRRDQPRRAGGADELIDADDVDLVVVASPNAGHFPYARAALLSGKHVVVDKPFVLSTAEADELIALAEQHGLVLSAFHNRRGDGDFLAVKQAVHSGELGEVLLFEARWDRFRPVAPEGWRNRAEPGAGLLWDLGPHLVDQALQLFGRPEGFTADIAAQREGALADDYFELTLRYGRRRVILSASCVVAEPRPRFAVHGTRGSLLTFGVDPGEAALKAGDHPADAGFQDRLPAIPAIRATGDRREQLSLPAGSWVPYYQRLAAAIRGQGPPPVPAREARQVIAMIEDAFAQAN